MGHTACHYKHGVCRAFNLHSGECGANQTCLDRGAGVMHPLPKLLILGSNTDDGATLCVNEHIQVALDSCWPGDGELSAYHWSLTASLQKGSIDAPKGSRISTTPSTGCDLPPLRLPPLRGKWELKACRVCKFCHSHQARFDSTYLGLTAGPAQHDWHCGATGDCTPPLKIVLQQCGAALPLAAARQRPCELADLTGRHALTAGHWRPDGTYQLSSCTLPPRRALASGLRSLPPRRVLFIGDSSVEDLALQYAHAVGYRFSELKVDATCVKYGGSLYRHFDAEGGTTDRTVSVAMRWSAAYKCSRNCGAYFDLSVAHPGWWNQLANRVRAFAPDTIVFGVAAAHLMCACSFYSKRRSCGFQAVQEDMRTHIRNVTQLAHKGTSFVLITPQLTNHRAAERDKVCNTDVGRLYEHSVSAFESLGLRKTHAVVVNLFPVFFSWLDVSSAREPLQLACSSQERHCSCLLTRNASENDRLWPADILPTCRLATRVLLAVTLGIGRTRQSSA